MFQTNIVFQTSTIPDGNMSFRFGREDKVAENRKKFVEKSGIDFGNLICMACNHGDIITEVTLDTKEVGATVQEEMIKAEVLVTKEKNLALMLLTADCLPTAFYDPIQEVIALAHLNRKTITHDLGQKTVSFLSQEYGTNPTNLLVNIGPYIHKESYAFDLPLTEPTPTQLAEHITEANGLAYVDMAYAEISQLEKVGLLKERITISEIDTATSPNHFSHYLSQKDTNYPQGRMATILMMT